MKTFLIDFPSFVIPTMLGAIKRKPNITREQLSKRVFGSISGRLNSLGVEPEDTIVFARDSANTWRTDFFPRYKHRRQKRKKNPAFDTIKLHRNAIFDQMSRRFRNQRNGLVLAIDVPKCEADDIIAVIAMNVEGEVVIVSSDKDFLQLKSDTIQVKNIDGEFDERSYCLETHIVFGDEGDSIPPVNAGGHYTYCDYRVWGLSSQNCAGFMKDGKLDLDTYPEFSNSYERNKVLVDFTCIPEEYSNAIMASFNLERESVNAIIEYRTQSMGR